MMSSLLIDLYEFTMAAAYHKEGIADRPATFSLFVRKPPASRGYLVAAGLDDALDWLEHLCFGPAEIRALEQVGKFGSGFLDWLAQLRFTGGVRAVPEGTLVFGEEPILEVAAPLAQAQLAESFLLNQVTVQTILATKAARCHHAAAGRAVVDFALRRTQGTDAAMKLARVAALVGLTGTSNVAGAVRYGIPAAGTMAHAFVQAYEHEIDAFRAFAALYGDATVLIVDTYNTHTGIERAIEVAEEMRSRGRGLRGIRLDSGDLAADAHYARDKLDAAGMTSVQIFVSGGLDEYDVERLVAQDAPIDGFGIGSALGVSDDAPTLDSVYKLVEIDGRPVRKTSPGKAIWPGAKQIWRDREFRDDVLGLKDEGSPGDGYYPLLQPVMAEGMRTDAGQRSLDEANRAFEKNWAQVPEALLPLAEPKAYAVRISAGLHRAAQRADESIRRG